MCPSIPHFRSTATASKYFPALMNMQETIDTVFSMWYVSYHIVCSEIKVLNDG
jgi:hypothetical protein